MTRAKYTIKATTSDYIIQVQTSDGSITDVCHTINLFWAIRIKNALNDGK